jgi:DNA-binding NarL/FixJ family response regulator
MLLHQEPGMHVVGMAIQTEGLLVQLEASRADLLLLDWRLPGASIRDLLSEIRGLESPPKIVVLSVKSEDKSKALSAGADGFISKTAPPDELIEVVRSQMKTVNTTR